MADILVVDDDQSVATAFERFLDAEGHTCRLASSAAEGIELIEKRPPNVVIMDVRMPGTDGLQALRQVRTRFPGIYVVMMTAYGTSQTSIDAIRAGAFDYLTKPLDLEQLRDVIAKALASQKVTDDTTTVVVPPEPVTLVGDSAAMLEVYKMIGRLATNSAPALVTGERGTGKHLVVATIHENSDRREKPLMTINCANVSEAELDVALSAEGAGTLELQDVHMLPAVQQIAVAQRLAAARTRSSLPPPTVRIIGTSDRNLADETKAGGFVQQLYDELAVVTLRLPPLRERREDIPLLVRQFVQRFNAELNRQIRGVDDQVSRALQQHPWPGNVAELERVIKRASIVARSHVITMDDIGDSLAEGRFSGGPEAVPALERAVRTALHDRLVQEKKGSSVFHDVVDAVETTLVREALVITNGNQLKAAEILGVNRATVRKKMPES